MNDWMNEWMTEWADMNEWHEWMNQWKTRATLYMFLYTFCWINAVFLFNVFDFSCLDLRNIPQGSKWVLKLCLKLRIRHIHDTEENKRPIWKWLTRRIGSWWSQIWHGGVGGGSGDGDIWPDAGVGSVHQAVIAQQGLGCSSVPWGEKVLKKKPLNNHVHQISCVLAPQTSRSIKDIVLTLWRIDSKIVELWCLCCTMMFRWINEQPGIQKFWNLCCDYQEIFDWISSFNKTVRLTFYSKTAVYGGN